MDADLWESKVWPVLAHRIPAFERIKVTTRWAGHYAYNTLDHNAVVGPHPELDGFVFINGFSGHGLQQAAAMGRGVAEWISYGEFRSIDLTPLGVERVIAGQPFAESAVWGLTPSSADCSSSGDKGSFLVYRLLPELVWGLVIALVGVLIAITA